MKEDAKIEVRVTRPREFEITRDRVEAIERLRKLRRRLPSSFTFDRVDTNKR
jgi:hypothetical protein